MRFRDHDTECTPGVVRLLSGAHVDWRVNRRILRTSPSGMAVMTTEEFIGKEVSFGPRPVTEEHMLAFCQGINEEGLSFTDPADEDFRAHPMYCVRSIIPASGMCLLNPKAGIDFQRIVHAGIEIRFHQAVLPGDELKTTSSLQGVEEKPKGRLLDVAFRTCNGRGEVVAEGTTCYFERGKGSEQEPANRDGEEDEEYDDSETTREVLLMTEVPTQDDQSILYAEGSGDRFPIHTNDEFARSVGLPGMILHGLCTLALSTALVLQRLNKGWADLSSVSCRFTHIALPGAELRVVGYRANGGNAEFETFDLASNKVLSDGWVRIRSS
ncbi:MAG TPA: hypothetical protein DIU15_20590 [Deltaproteobacteria bacterium]|nr:hypothetical protein [Deltaproteobacteria bacterium]HCP48447.1 hypothetical protein [Deltaproteobacteria bacterium]